MMSFSIDVKEEIVRYEFANDGEKKALLSSLARINGTISMGKGGVALEIRSENAKIAKLLFVIIKDLYNVDARILVAKKMKLKKNNVYLLQVGNRGIEILEDLQIYKNGKLDHNPNKDILKNTGDLRAYLMGSFLASGSVNDPVSKNYHLEITTHSDKHAEFLTKIISKFELNAKIIKRRNVYVVYIKKSEEISDFLRIINANNCVLDFEEERINKDYWNSNNRLTICEVSNEVKTIKSANTQLEYIEKIYAHSKEYLLDEKDKKIISIRKENPEANMQEIADIFNSLYGTNVSKSGINHRLRKIKEIANNIEE
jgi:DNA-binding protein WhiA